MVKAKQQAKQLSKAISTGTLGKRLSAFAVAKAKREAEKDKMEDGMATLVSISAKDPDRRMSGASLMSVVPPKSGAGDAVKVEPPEDWGFRTGSLRRMQVKEGTNPEQIQNGNNLRRVQSERVPKKNESNQINDAGQKPSLKRGNDGTNLGQTDMTIMEAVYQPRQPEKNPEEIVLSDDGEEVPAKQSKVDTETQEPKKKRKKHRKKKKIPDDSVDSLDSGIIEQVDSTGDSTENGTGLDESGVDGVVERNGVGGEKDSRSESAIWTMWDSTVAADTMLEWLIGKEISKEKFFKSIWEKRPFHVSRNQPDYYRGIFSSEELDNILKSEDIVFGRNLDVTRYVDEKRETLNPEGRAHSAIVWRFFHEEGCSVRIVNPQTYSDMVWKICSHLQEAFGSFVGANVYLTPPDTQGFAPHWDDIDAFMLQLEGQKHWKVYVPRTDEETLPRESSRNFSSENLPDPPVMEMDMKAGDLLYVPRGYIHEGSTTGLEEHSMHITLSVSQRNTWGDLLAKLLPVALEKAVAEDVEFRRSLPRNFLSTMGLINQPGEEEDESKGRKKFKRRLCELMQGVSDAVIEMADAGVDQVAKEFTHSALPPVLTENELACSIHGQEGRWRVGRKGKQTVNQFTELTPTTKVKLLRRHALRMCMESETEIDEEMLMVYHTVENSRIFQDKDLQGFDIPSELAGGLEHLYRTYPEYVQISDLEDIETTEEKLSLCKELYERGLLITEEPLV